MININWRFTGGSTFRFPLENPLALNITTSLSSRIIASPVWGLRPFRDFFSFTDQVLNPEIFTGSSDYFTIVNWVIAHISKGCDIYV